MIKTYKLLDKNNHLLKTPILLNHKLQIGGNMRLLEGDFDKIYEKYDRSDIYSKSRDEENLVASTYGEILPSSVNNLINELKIDNSDVFYDLGSGAGKLVMQMYMNSDVGKSKGIEFQTNRYNISENALKKLYKLRPELLDDDRIISYYNGNIADFNLDDATIIFMCSTCFTPDLMNVVLGKVKNNKNLKYIISLKDHDNFKSVLPNIKTITQPMSWASSTNINIYSK